MRRHRRRMNPGSASKDSLPGQAGDSGVTAKDNRLSINAAHRIA